MALPSLPLPLFIYICYPLSFFIITIHHYYYRYYEKINSLVFLLFIFICE